MNKKVFTLSIIDNKLPLFICFCFLSGTIISFYLSISISDYFYFLSVPVLLLTLYLIKLIIGQVKNEYKRLIKKEKYFNDGPHLEYFHGKKRQVKFELHIINGERHGSYKSYYENGQIELECNYINGELDGIYKSYFINGQIETDCNYINGELDGIYKSYFINGQIETDCNYEKGELHGEYKEYHENGNLKLQTQCKKGTQTGETKSFYDNGNKYREKNLINDEYEGEIKEYFKNGNLKFVSYNDNYTFYKNNNIACEIEYGNPPKGIWKNYRDDGTIEYKLDFDIKYADRVLKTIYTKGGDIYSKKEYGYEINRNASYNFKSSYSRERYDSETISIRNLVGPPGPGFGGGSTIVKLKPISSIEDIIELTPIKDFENE
jgi:antitoxin component YwqK of YwqJK toxin-antitoxin module